MTMTEPRRYAPGRARQEEILDAAHELFAASGFGGVSLRAIAARTGVSHAAVLRYYASKDDILIALLDRWEERNVEWMTALPEVDYVGSVVGMARRNAEIPGYLALYAALAGEASSAAHPAHEHLRERYERLRASYADLVGREDSVSVSAAWDGLQVMSQYLDDIDVVRELEAYFERNPVAPPRIGDVDAEVPASRVMLPFETAPVADDAGYAPGREKRARTIEAATALFAQRGFSGTSLRAIAERVGVAKSTLLHHFGSKDALLEAVLERRDERVNAAIASGPSVREYLRAVVAGARENARAPGLIELYTVLSAEGTGADHPAHDYFARRYRWAVGQFEGLFSLLREGGEIADSRDPRREAVWFVALWDGLQVQWLYDPSSTDVAESLRAHLETLLLPVAGPR